MEYNMYDKVWVADEGKHAALFCTYRGSENQACVVEFVNTSGIGWPREDGGSAIPFDYTIKGDGLFWLADMDQISRRDEVFPDKESQLEGKKSKRKKKYLFPPIS